MKRSSNSAWSRKPDAEVASRACDHPGCQGSGAYRAPRSRAQLDDYFWFCLEHVRTYNASWNYYAGMQPDEIEALVRQDVTWQRPTWPLGAMLSGRARVRVDAIHDPFGFLHEAEIHAPKTRAPTVEDKAMRVLELEAPLTLPRLKARYKELVKRHHPDANGGDKQAEERFKAISEAYKTLMNSLNA